MSIAYKLRMFAVAIAITSVLVGVYFALLQVSYSGVFESVEGIGIIVTTGAIPIVAMPVAYLLNVANIQGYIAWASAGLAAGALASLALSFILSGGALTDLTWINLLNLTALGGILGLASGIFWWRAVGRYEQLRKPSV